MTLPELRDAARRVAIGEIGTREQGGANRGRRVEEYLAAAKLPPGQPWCAAFVIWCYQRAAEAGGWRSPLPAIGHVGHFFRRIEPWAPHWISHIPTIGAIACHQKDPTDPDSAGHTGIVLAVEGGTVMTVEGNSNSTGSREGVEVVENHRPLSYWSLGFIDVGRFGPPGLPSAA